MMQGYKQKITAVQKEMDKTKEIMTRNVDALIIRGEKIDKLVGLTHELEQRSEIFAHNAHKLKWKLYLRDFSLQAVLIGVGSGLLYSLLSGHPLGGILLHAVLGGLIGYKIGKISLLGGLFMLHHGAKPEGKSKGKSKKVKTNKEIMETELAAQQAAEQKKLAQLQAEVDKDTKIMLEVIDELKDRGENIESLKKKTVQLEEGSKIFKKTSRKIEISAWARTVSIGLNLSGLIVGVAYALWHGYSMPMVLGCGLFGCGIMFTVGQIASYFKPLIEGLAWYEGLGNPFKGMSEYIQNEEARAAVILQEAKDYLPKYRAQAPEDLPTEDPLAESLNNLNKPVKPH
jgi:hypothetical protein